MALDGTTKYWDYNGDSRWFNTGWVLLFLGIVFLGVGLAQYLKRWDKEKNHLFRKDHEYERTRTGACAQCVLEAAK